MKLSIQLESVSDVIFNPKPTKDTDNVLRDPKDAHKILKHLRRATGLRFKSRFTVQERSSGNHIYTDIASVESKDKDGSNKNLTLVYSYLKRNGWSLVKGHKTNVGASIWKHKLSYLHFFIGPTVLSRRGVGFSIEVVGTESDSYLRAMHRKHKHGPATNKIHEALKRQGENATVIRTAASS